MVRRSCFAGADRFRAAARKFLGIGQNRDILLQGCNTPATVAHVWRICFFLKSAGQTENTNVSLLLSAFTLSRSGRDSTGTRRDKNSVKMV